MSHLKINNLLFFVLFSIFTSFANANTDLVGRCDGCNDTQKQTYARSWAISLLPTNAYPGTVISTVISVVDLKFDTLTTYRINSMKLPGGGGMAVPPWQTGVVIVSSPATVATKFNNVKLAKGELLNLLNATVIPTSVVGHPWEFVDCGYCENNIQSYLQSTANGKIEAVWLTSQALLLSFGVLNSPLATTYVINFEGGGQVMIEANISVGMKLVIKVIKVIDANNNTVPLKSVDLQNYNIWVPSELASESISSYLNNVGFYLPPGAIGIVTIQDCSKDPSIYEDVCE